MDEKLSDMPIEDYIASNKKKTYFLFGVFIAIILALLLLPSYLLGYEIHWAGIIMWAVIGVIIFTVFYFKGDNVLARAVGAKKIKDENDERYIWHTTEALAIGAGISMPDLYVIETDTPNAFAAGRSPDRASLAVTRGLIEKLDRNELEAVIAHEIAHIKNYDIRVATIAVVLTLIIYMISRGITGTHRRGRVRGGSRGKGRGLGALILLILAILAPIFAKMIQYSISREREYLADSTGAEISNNPDALASALEKIAGLNTGEDETLENDAMQSLFFVCPMSSDEYKTKGFGSKAFKTHPPVEERLKRLRAMA